MLDLNVSGGGRFGTSTDGMLAIVKQLEILPALCLQGVDKGADGAVALACDAV